MPSGVMTRWKEEQHLAPVQLPLPRFNTPYITETVSCRTTHNEHTKTPQYFLDTSLEERDFERILCALTNASVAHKQNPRVAPVEPTKTSTEDFVHELEGFYVDGRPIEGRVRYTKEDSGAEVLIIKRKTETLDIFLPLPHRYDMRLQASIEEHIPLTAELRSAFAANKPISHRGKDRTSFKHGPFSFDLTRVGEFDESHTERSKRLEAELEICFPAELVSAKMSALGDGNRARFTTIIHAFLTNARTLALAASQLIELFPPGEQ